MGINLEKMTEFLQDYEVLCRKHGLYLHGCGCCGSPFLNEMNAEYELFFNDYTKHVCYEEYDFYKDEVPYFKDGEIRDEREGVVTTSQEKSVTKQ